ncbi:hypothetical protein OS175_10560 [Marinicella sp. S1101]|uniref:hypothetical protein n=1 Tax=Marinicella marina TaxID=2996016 RepID=UPI002260FCD0|nr:hypothetical protein [Marinicella marina]MCX7554322.1 hypothetical protein [Marinicella marina]
MQHSIIAQIKSRNAAYQNAKTIEKKIRYLQRELVRASFQGSEKTAFCRKLLNLIKKERQKIKGLPVN